MTQRQDPKLLYLHDYIVQKGNCKNNIPVDYKTSFSAEEIVTGFMNCLEILVYVGSQTLSQGGTEKYDR